MVRSRQILALLCYLCFWYLSNGTLVTRNMDKPRQGFKEINEEDLGRPGRNIKEKLKITASTPLPPVVCIPGIGGSQLNAYVHRKNSTHWYCRNSDDYYMIWLSLSSLLPGPPLDCWIANIKLQYNVSTDTFSNATDVDIVVPYFGSTDGFEYLDPYVKSETAYFISLVNSLVQTGYTKGKNLFGSPYDWRLNPRRSPGLYTSIQQLIESAYESNNQMKVAIICHSMGNLFFLSFLRTMTQEWKDKYLLSYFATSPPIVGASMAVQALTSGYDFSIPYLSAAGAKAVQQTFASTYFLLPYPKFYNDTIFATTPSKNYTAQNYDQLLSDLGISPMYKIWEETLTMIDPYEPPGVPTYCLYGYNISTFYREEFATNNLNKAPLKMIYGDGDGTVPIDSLTFCENWVGHQSQSVTVQGYPNVDHVGLLLDATFIQDVITYIMNTTSA